MLSVSLTPKVSLFQREVHIAGDVALFVKQYCQITQNASELREFFPLLEGISDFVVSRVNRTDANGWLSVENIVEPDESTGSNSDTFSICALPSR